MILPQGVAFVKLEVIVPIARDEEEWQSVVDAGEKIRADLHAKGVLVKLDDDRKQKPGWKFAQHEMLGTPLRVEIGPRDLAQEQIVLARRDTREKTVVPMAGLTEHVSAMLDTIQQAIYNKAKNFRDSHIFECETYDELKTVIAEEKGWVKAFWNGDREVEAQIKTETKATIRCIPFDQPETLGTCIYTGEPAKYQVLFAKAY